MFSLEVAELRDWMTDLGSRPGILSHRRELANECEGITYFMFVDTSAWHEISWCILYCLICVYAPGLMPVCQFPMGSYYPLL